MKVNIILKLPLIPGPDWTLIALFTLFMTSSDCANRMEAVLESQLAGKSRLLYYCVWIVYVNQRSANPASPLDERPEWSKFATKASIAQLHLAQPSVLWQW